jgi:hypothetical protein
MEAKAQNWEVEVQVLACLEETPGAPEKRRMDSSEREGQRTGAVLAIVAAEVVGGGSCLDWMEGWL